MSTLQSPIAHTIMIIADKTEERRAPNGKQKRIQLLWACLWAYLWFSVLFDTISLNRIWLTGDSESASTLLMQKDGDVPYIIANIRQHPTFLSTFDWCHSNWAGLFNFWRPLTSFGFWLQYHLFSGPHFAKYQIVLIVSHLMFVGMLCLLAKELTGSWTVSALSALLFAGSHALFPFNISDILFASVDPHSFKAPAEVAISVWKDEPESWAGICIIGAMLLALHRRWVLCLACIVAGICFKETGWLAFPLALGILAFKHRLQTIPRYAIVLAGVCIIVLIALRASSGPSVLFAVQPHRNNSWLTVYLRNIGGLPAALAVMRWHLVILGAALAVLIQLYRGVYWKKILLAISAIAAVAQLAASVNGYAFTTSLVTLLDPQADLINWLCITLWFVIAWEVCVKPKSLRTALFIFVLGSLIVLPTTRSLQSNQHLHYQHLAFQAILISFAICTAFDGLIRRFGSFAVIPKKV